MSDHYDRVTADLSKAYDGSVAARSARQKGEPPWMIPERQDFLDLIRNEGDYYFQSLALGRTDTGAVNRRRADRGE